MNRVECVPKKGFQSRKTSNSKPLPEGFYNERLRCFVSRDDYMAMATEIMFHLVSNRNTLFTTDDFKRLARREFMPPAYINEFCATTFREFEKAGYIRDTSTTVISTIDGISKMTVWIPVRSD